jgi:DNA-binding NarL/FixJ family response regulator
MTRPDLAAAAIQVAIVSRDRMLREALAASLSALDGLRVVAAEAELAAAAQGAGLPQVDVALVEAGYDRRSSLARTREAWERWEGAEVVVLGLEREDEVADFVEAGAHAYVLQGASLASLVEVVREVHQGRSPCSPRVAAAVLRRIFSLSKVPVPRLEIEPLTAREREVLSLLARGLGNKAVCRCLQITVQTVKNHVHSILAKMGVHRRREAVRLAYELGLLAEEESGM